MHGLGKHVVSHALLRYQTQVGYGTRQTLTSLNSRGITLSPLSSSPDSSFFPCPSVVPGVSACVTTVRQDFQSKNKNVENGLVMGKHCASQ